MLGILADAAVQSEARKLFYDQASKIFKEFSGNLHFTHYAQGKYVIERKFMYL